MSERIRSSTLPTEMKPSLPELPTPLPKSKSSKHPSHASYDKDSLPKTGSLPLMNSHANGNSPANSTVYNHQSNLTPTTNATQKDDADSDTTKPIFDNDEVIRTKRTNKTSRNSTGSLRETTPIDFELIRPPSIESSLPKSMNENNNKKPSEKTVHFESNSSISNSNEIHENDPDYAEKGIDDIKANDGSISRIHLPDIKSHRLSNLNPNSITNSGAESIRLIDPVKTTPFAGTDPIPTIISSQESLTKETAMKSSQDSLNNNKKSPSSHITTTTTRISSKSVGQTAHVSFSSVLGSNNDLKTNSKLTSETVAPNSESESLKPSSVSPPQTRVERSSSESSFFIDGLNPLIKKYPNDPVPPVNTTSSPKIRHQPITSSTPSIHPVLRSTSFIVVPGESFHKPSSLLITEMNERDSKGYEGRLKYLSGPVGNSSVWTLWKDCYVKLAGHFLEVWNVDGPVSQVIYFFFSFVVLDQIL